MRQRWRSSMIMAEAARVQRFQLTPAEQSAWNMLRSLRPLGWTFRRQVPMDRFVLDFYCPRAKLAVEIDGSIHNMPSVRDSDATRQEHLDTRFGIRFLRFTNEDVLTRPVHVKGVVVRTLELEDELGVDH